MELLELAAKLVSFDTVSSKTTVPMAQFIAEYLQALGFEIEWYPYQLKGVGKVNLIARKGGQNSHLVLAGHMDTVPAGKWETDPLKLTKTKNGFHGLGIADMKFFLAVAMKAGEAVLERDLARPFALCFTSDEEVGCLGAKKLAEKLKKQGRIIGRHVVIGEPTKFRPILAYKGYIYLEVEVEARKESHQGRNAKDNSSHSSDPRTTTNVVEKTLPAVIEEMQKFKARLEDVHDDRFDPDYPTMNIGGVIVNGRRIVKKEQAAQEKKQQKKEQDSGDESEQSNSEKEEREEDREREQAAKNTIPRGYSIEGDIRPVPDQDLSDLIHILRYNIKERISQIKATGLGEKLHVEVKWKRAPTKPVVLTRNSPMVALIEEISGQDPGTIPFNTEREVFGKTGSEAIVWGPTDIGQAHADNEYVVAELFREETVEQYVRLIRAMCV